MKSAFILYFLLFFSYHLLAQVTLIREGILINNTETENWYGDVIPRSVPTALSYRNNSITSINKTGYMLQAGDEGPGSNNSNLDGAVITGNKFKWNGVNDPSILTHGVFTGYNKNLTVKYNYLENVPLGLLFKSGTDDGINMTFTSGGCAYNICKNEKINVRMKGINGLKVYNNTFYSGDGGGRCLVLITSNDDRITAAPSTGAEIFNNIFYTTSLMPMIAIESSSLAGFKCDYNVYWCEVREPIFAIDGINLTWADWKARGYDLHSKIINPDFIDLVNFVPSTRLNFGTNLGAEWQTGLSTTAQWVLGTSPATANQNGTWQVGASLYKHISVSGISVNGAGGENTITTDNGSLQLSAGITPDDATDKTITWSIANGEGLATITTTGLVTAIANGNVAVRATANDGSGIIGELEISITNQKILVENISIIDTLANDTIKGIDTKLILNAAINPSNATDQSISWSVENLTGKATINANGLLTTISQGTINVVAKANDGSQSFSQKQYVIAIPVTAFDLLHQDNFWIFPNPTLDKIQIQTGKMPSEGIVVKIMNINGQILEKKRVFESVTEWSVAQYSSDVLLINVTDDRGSITKKVIVVSKLK